MYAKFFQKKIRNVIVLIKRREVITQFIMPLNDSKDAPIPSLFNSLTLKKMILATVITLIYKKTSVNKLFQNFVNEKNFLKVHFFGGFSKHFFKY